MNNGSLQKWQSLLEQLDINFKDVSCLSKLNHTQISDFESTTDLNLPKEYKKFCQVFGSGEFGQSGFFIDCPNCQKPEAQLTSDEIILDACQGFSTLSNRVLSPKEQDLFASAYLFGGGPSYVSFIFDLKTFQLEDESCDIYGIDCQNTLIYYLGRDFYRFVCDICIGDRAQKEFPELVKLPLDFDPNDPRNQSTTFFPFPLSEEDVVGIELDESQNEEGG